jgi:hypothetical protein
MSQIPEGCPMFDGPCATTELAASINGPVGGECVCGWAFGTYLQPPELHPTNRDLNRMEGP